MGILMRSAARALIGAACLLALSADRVRRIRFHGVPASGVRDRGRGCGAGGAVPAAGSRAGPSVRP